MSIQSNINQALGTASVLTGLWAHSPEGKKFLETKQLKKQGTELQKAQLKAEKQEESDALYEKLTEVEKRLASVNPTTKSISGDMSAQQRALDIEFEEKESKAGEEKDLKSEAIRKAILSAQDKEISNYSKNKLIENLSQIGGDK